MRAITPFLALLLVGGIGCRSGSKALSVHDLLADARHQEGRLVLVEGCYHAAIDSHYLTDCQLPSAEFALWVEDYDFARVVMVRAGNGSRDLLPRAGLSAGEQQTYRSLLTLPAGSLRHVVLIGQFQACSEGPENSGCNWRLVLHRVASMDGNSGNQAQASLTGRGDD